MTMKFVHVTGCTSEESGYCGPPFGLKVASFVMLIALDPCVCFLLFDHLLYGCFALSPSLSLSLSLSLSTIEWLMQILVSFCIFSIHSFCSVLFSVFTLLYALVYVQWSMNRTDERTEAGKEQTEEGKKKKMCE